MDAVLQRLKAALDGVCETVTEFQGSSLTGRSQPLMVAGIKSAVAENGADYLGSSGEQELYGLGIKAVFSLDILSPGVASECRELFGQTVEALRARTASGLRINRFSCGELCFDETLYMYRLPCLLEADTFIYALADESGRFVDFDLSGVTFNS